MTQSQMTVSDEYYKSNHITHLKQDNVNMFTTERVMAAIQCILLPNRFNYILTGAFESHNDERESDVKNDLAVYIAFFLHVLGKIAHS